MFKNTINTLRVFNKRFQKFCLYFLFVMYMFVMVNVGIETFNVLLNFNIHNFMYLAQTVGLAFLLAASVLIGLYLTEDSKLEVEDIYIVVKSLDDEHKKQERTKD